MNDFETIIKNITDIKKEVQNKNIELKQLKEKQVSLNEELEMCQTKISWLKEDIEDMVCNHFHDAKRVHIDKEYEYIEIEFFVGSEINLIRIETFAKKINKTLYDCRIFCDADASMYLKIIL